MESVSLFDWFRWVEVPILLAIAGALVNHMMKDHKVEIELKEGLAKVSSLSALVEGMDRRQDLIIEKLLNGGKNDRHD